LYNFYDLSSEEKRFIKTNFKLANDLISNSTQIIQFLSPHITEHIKSEKSNEKDNKFFTVIIVYLLPLMLQHYQAMIFSLEKGFKASAACLFRVLLEFSIDYEYLAQNPHLTERYFDYYIRSYQWDLENMFNAAGRKDLSRSINREHYNKLLKKYNIHSEKELNTWSGKSIKQMAMVASSIGKILHWHYVRYSSYIHPSSTAGLIFHNNAVNNDENTLQNVFFDCFFMGSLVINTAMDTVESIFKFEDSDIYKKHMSENVKFYKTLVKVCGESVEWHKNIESFYGSD